MWANREQNSCNLIGWCGRQTWGKKTVLQVMMMWSGNKAILDYKQIKVICYQLELWKQLADISTECSSRHRSKSQTTGAVSQNVGKLFSKLKLVTDDLPLHLCRSQLRSYRKSTHKPNLEEENCVRLEVMDISSVSEDVMIPCVTWWRERWWAPHLLLRGLQLLQVPNHPLKEKNKKTTSP